MSLKYNYECKIEKLDKQIEALKKERKEALKRLNEIKKGETK